MTAARRRTRVLAIGDAIVDVVSPPIRALSPGDAQLRVPAITVLPGGNATNFALQMAALGSPTSLVASVGQDPFADILRRAYRQARVDARLRVDPKRPTGATMAITWANGRRALITALGANGGLRERDVPLRLFETAGHVHRAGFWWTTGLMGAPTARLLARARRAGASTSLDISTDPEGWRPERVRHVRATLPSVDTFFATEAEACAVGHVRRGIDAAFKLVDEGAAEVVLHLGERGSAWVGDGKVVRSPAFRVPVDNPTGCGDVFNAGYVFAKQAGAPVGERLGFGNALAALHLASRSRPNPSLEEVRAFLRAAR